GPSEPVPYELRIEGPLDAFGDGASWGGAGEGAQTVEAVVSWGATGATSLAGAAFGATRLTTVPTWLPATVRDLSDLFRDATAFDQELGGWDVSNVTDLTRTFAGATAFRAGVAAWDVGNVTSTNATFEGATAFDEDLGAWDVANVVDFTSTFEGAAAFAGDVRTWDTGAARWMDGMFRDATSFDGDVGGWDVAGVQDLSSAFEGATAFDRDLGGWDVRSVLNMDGTFEGSGMSQAAYDATLVGWAAAIEGEGAPVRVVHARPFSPADAAVPRIYRADLEASDETVSASTVVVLEAGHGFPFEALRAGEADDRFWVRLVTDDVSLTDVYLNVGPPDAFAADRTRELALPLGLQDAESLTHDDVRGRVLPLPVEGVELGAPPYPGGAVTHDVMRPSTPAAQAACDALVGGLGWTVGGVSTTDVACRLPPG
ncbi:MAG: BspA family leucine-rich repeat surface protein, partial [Trueperaceae bacterium]|nr:BspA family leucine-rich repeat surface protein [Trueperaceae bacterium]